MNWWWWARFLEKGAVKRHFHNEILNWEFESFSKGKLTWRIPIKLKRRERKTNIQRVLDNGILQNFFNKICFRIPFEILLQFKPNTPLKTQFLPPKLPHHHFTTFFSLYPHQFKHLNPYNPKKENFFHTSQLKKYLKTKKSFVENSKNPKNHKTKDLNDLKGKKIIM